MQKIPPLPPFLRLTLIFLALELAACNSTPGNSQAQTASISTAETTPLEQSGAIRQWAAGAVASSEFANPEWAAQQATGAPDTLHCGDYQTAWATAGSDIRASLTLTYTRAVHVTGVNIIQTFNPNQVVIVELLGPFDRPLAIYQGTPTQVDQPCPYTLSIALPRSESRYNRLRITVDQSVLGLGWNQIDAVELIGEID